MKKGMVSHTFSGNIRFIRRNYLPFLNASMLMSSPPRRRDSSAASAMKWLSRECSSVLVRSVFKMLGQKREDAAGPAVGRGVSALAGEKETQVFSCAPVLVKDPEDAALAVCLGYLAVTGWYLSAADVLLLGLDVLLLSLFGTALSSIVNCNLTTNGQASAVGTIVSAGYGFLCGAYMPISNFGEGLQRVLSFLPGTYGTALFRNHALRGVYAEMTRTGFPAEVVEHIKDSIDCNLYFFGSKVSIGAMTGVMAGSVAVLIGIYILMNLLKKTD